MIFDRAQVAAALPGYDLGRELGSGAFGVVLEGHHCSLDREVAIKIARLPDAGRERFASEARLLAKVEHPHVVHIYDYIEWGELAVIVMERLSGGSLQDWAYGGVTAVEACAVIVAIALGCERAHGAGILHRDIKPSNILFTADRAPKLTDFGIAKVLSSTYATASQAVGSASYMAPEQFRVEQLSRATDVYALGAVLYELLAGRPPFGHDEAQVMANRHAFGTVPALTAVPSVPEPVAAVVDRALSKQPAARQPSAARFAEELARAASSAFGPGWMARSGVTIRADDARQLAALMVAPTRPVGRGETIVMAGSGESVMTGTSVLAGASESRLGGRFQVGDNNGRPSRPRDDGYHRWRGGGDGDGTGEPERGRWWGRWWGRRWVAVLVAGCVALALAVVGSVAIVRTSEDEDPYYYTDWESPLTDVRLTGWVGLAVDGRGRLFMTDSGRHTLTMLTPEGTSRTIIGDGPEVDEPLPGIPSREPWQLAGQAQLYRPGGVAVASDGTVFVADTGNCVVRMLREEGQGPDMAWEVSTVAGKARESRDDGRARNLERDCPAPPPAGPRGRAPASDERIGTPVDVAVDDENNLYIATGYAGQLWMVDRRGEWSGRNNPYSARPRLVAGTADIDPRFHEPVGGFDGPRVEAEAVGLDNVYSVAAAPGGDVYLVSKVNRSKVPGGTDRIHLVDEDGFIRTVWKGDENVDIKDVHVGESFSGPARLLVADLASEYDYMVTAGGNPEPLADTSDYCSGSTGATTDGAGNIFMSCNVRQGLEGARILVFDAARGGGPRVIAE